jgi:hypothetical protein
MRVSYIGLFDEVYVPDIDAPVGRVVRRGEIVEVPDEVGGRMLEQPANWAKAGGKSAPAGGNE